MRRATHRLTRLVARPDGRGVTAALALCALALFAVAAAWPSSARAPEPLLVADLRGHALIVLDPADPAAATRIALPGGPHELLRLPDGRVAVSLEQSGALAFADVARGEVETLEVGGLPHGLALDGRTLLVTDRSVDAVRRFDLDDGMRELAPVPVEAWPHAVAVLPGGGLAVASAQAGTLTLGDTLHETGAMSETVAVAPDGRVAVAAALDSRVSVYSPSGELLESYEVGGRPVRVAFSPDGRMLAVARSASASVALIEAGEVRSASVAGVPDGLAFSSDGRVVYASDVYGGRITAVRASDGHVLAVIEAGRGTGAILAWSAP